MPSAKTAHEVTTPGDDLVGIRLADTREAQALADHLRNSGDWIDCVAGLDSCVARYDLTRLDAAQALEALREAASSVPSPDEGVAGRIEIPVCYGGAHGPDLGNICEQLDLSRDQVIELHSGRDYRVDLLGFTPGFAFIGGLDTALNVPRRREPRVRLEPGSIGIAGGRTGIYALGGPGGWPIIGRTPSKLFDAHADEPFGLRAGMTVRFVPITVDEFERLSHLCR